MARISESGEPIEPVYGLARVIAYPIRPLFHVRRIGSRRVPRQGAVLLACNHISLLDPVIVLWLGECTRRKVRFLAMAELWNTPVLRFFLEHTHQIPVDRASAGALGSLDVLEWIFEIEEEAGFVIDEQLYSKASLATATVGDFYERVKSSRVA